MSLTDFKEMRFNPMNKNLADIIINPLYIIYYFISGVDFMKIGEKNYVTINEKNKRLDAKCI